MADTNSKPPAYLKALLEGIRDNETIIDIVLEEVHPLSKLLSGSYHKSHEHSDLIITCKGREWKVHKLIVCPQSEPINAAVQKFKEGDNGVYPMEEHDPQVAEAFIRYLYSFDYGDDGNGQDDAAAIVFDVRMFIVADKYFVAPLAELAGKKFEERCKNEWASSDFAEAVKELYENGLDCSLLKDVAVNTIQKHAAKVLAHNRQAEFADLNEVLRTTELGADVSCALVDKR